MSTYYNIHTHQAKKAPEIISVTSYSVDDKQINTESYFSIGIHPWFIKDPESQLDKLKSYLNHPNLVAIGECGLDMLEGNDLEKQIMVFKGQVELSELYQKPLIIHCVKGYHILLELKKELNPEQPWIVHGFNGKPELAIQLTQQNISLSLGISWLKKPDHFNKLSESIPGQRIFFETDEAPVDDIKKIYSLAATFNPGLYDVINHNVKKVFKI
ncbi:TatD family hydrolase [Saccharicrinis sp. FJH2]|uniref:TatD family hydrolase n=1 Tax=Saccharicrinis sp. FJH65 TaxID=3344659 RepID=UPI0035F3825C